MNTRSLERRAAQEVAALAQAGLLRTPQTCVSGARAATRSGGRTLVNFSSNNYLGLAHDHRLSRAAGRAARKYGWGAGASRLVSGTTPAHEALERSVARWMGTPAAVLFSSGYMANLSVVQALAGPGDVVYSDALNHASLIDACRNSRAEARVYRHCDAKHLERLLKADRGRPGRRIVLTESLFSVDGDAAPLAGLAEVARSHGAWLYVDEAHAVGVFGKTGRGLAEELGIEDRIDLRMGTFSKALGSYGAFVGCGEETAKLLRNRSRAYVFTTALPPAVCAASGEGLRIMLAEPARRKRLWDNVHRLSAGLAASGWDLVSGDSHIVCVSAGTPERVMAMAEDLRQRGFWVAALRPPTVPPGGSRLRISVTAVHTRAQIDRFVEAMADLNRPAKAKRNAAGAL